MKASTAFMLRSTANRHGDIIVAAVELAIEDINAWMTRRKIAFRTENRLRMRRVFEELRFNAQLADGWFTGRFESTITFKECCELLGQNHAAMVGGLYDRWPREQIVELRTATALTDLADMDRAAAGFHSGSGPELQIENSRSCERFLSVASSAAGR